MKIQAQISIYPLRTDSLREPVNEFCGILKDKGLEVQTHTMSTSVTGESAAIFECAQEAFEKLAQRYEVVMDLKVSNTCPTSEIENED